jgi:hypothetical protein
MARHAREVRGWGGGKVAVSDGSTRAATMDRSAAISDMPNIDWPGALAVLTLLGDGPYLFQRFDNVAGVDHCVRDLRLER